MRKISDCNPHYKNNAKDLMRDGKIWCGGCKIGIRYIFYPETVEYYDNSNAIFKKKPENVPISPPWTTWSGTILCDENSEIGKKIRETDPNAEAGYLFIDREKVQIPGKIRGLWTAPSSGQW